MSENDTKMLFAMLAGAFITGILSVIVGHAWRLVRQRLGLQRRGYYGVEDDDFTAISIGVGSVTAICSFILAVLALLVMLFRSWMD